MQSHPGMSLADAHRAVLATNQGGTLLLRHERELRDLPDSS
jgi:hypothetical protein